MTIASRFVTCESVSVVTRIASSTSRRTSESRSSAARRLGQQPVDVVAVAGVGRHPPRRRVRMREQPALLEHGELVADRRGPGGHLGVGGERLGADRLAGLREAVHHLAEQQGLAGSQHHFRF